MNTKNSWVRCQVSPAIAGKAYNVAVSTGKPLPEVYALMLSEGASALTVEQLVAKVEAAPAHPKAAPAPAAADKPKGK